MGTYSRVAWVLAVWYLSALGQPLQTWRVFFRDKGPDPWVPGSPLYEQTLALHSARALARRTQVRPPDSLITLADAPLYEPYLDSVRRYGTVRFLLRWKNYAVVETDSLGAEALRRLPFVRAVQPTREVPLPREFPLPVAVSPAVEFPMERLCETCAGLDYGLSWTQLQMLGVPAVHRMGIAGDSVVIGVLDTGFRWRGHPVFARLRVAAEWDVLKGDSVTANEAGDHPRQDTHGTLVLSVLGGFWDGKLIGVAPRATYVLAKTEDIAAERHIEEDAYAAAVEWMEALGVDVVSSSLGYREFDSADASYTPGQLDGATTIVAQALQEAARRGVICVTAMGNDAARGLVSPADADSAIAVAAVDSTGQRAAFSSVGLRRGALLRPSVAAPGVAVAAVGPDGELVRVSGTSLATPLVAGVVALLRAARPELPPWVLRQALLQTASQATRPDTLLGYGIPNLWRALRYVGGALGPVVVWRLPSGRVRAAAYGLCSDIALGAWLQWASAPDERALLGARPARIMGTEPVLLYSELPQGLGEASDTVWLRFVLRGGGGCQLRTRWYALTTVPNVPCGVEIPEVLREETEEMLLPVRLAPNPVPRGQECTAWVPGVHPSGSGDPLLGVRLWDALGRMQWEFIPSTRLDATEWMLRLPTAGLAPGVYWLEAFYGASGSVSVPFVLY